MAKLSRRDFLKGIAAGTLSVAGMGVLGAVAPTAHAEGAPAGTKITDTIYSTASWRVKPEPIPASDIGEVRDVDVCVIGLGHAGATCAMTVAENGFSVIALELLTEESFSTTGNDFGHINSKLSESLGGGSGYDPIEFMNNWMINSANAANPVLAMKFAQNSGEAIDWWYDKAGEGTAARLVFQGPNEERPHIQTEAGVFHFYCSSVSFSDTAAVKNCAASVKELNPDSEFLFGHKGLQLIQAEDGTVSGVIAQNVVSGEYVQVNAKAVVVCTGGFSANSEMCHDLLVDLELALQHNDQYRKMQTAGMSMPAGAEPGGGDEASSEGGDEASSEGGAGGGSPMMAMGFGRDGSGIAMLYHAGAHLEQNPGTMDGRASWQTSSPALVPMLSHPQGIHLDYTGRRFYNEYWGPIEMRSRPLMSRNRDLFYAVFDDNLTEYMQYVPASHGTTNPTKATLDGVRAIMDAAYAVKGTGYYDSASMSTWYAGDSIEEIVAAMGLDEKVAANILASVSTWNASCAAGADSELGREAKFLFPIEQGPFYIQVNENNLMLGNFLVTVGGVYVDGDQRVLSQDWYPIPGLFASGNTTVGRFGWDYFSPAYGVSVGMATTLGRECGKSVTQYLNGELV